MLPAPRGVFYIFTLRATVFIKRRGWGVNPPAGKPREGKARMKNVLVAVSLLLLVSCAAPPKPVPEAAPGKAAPAVKKGAPIAAATPLEGRWREVRNRGRAVRGRVIWTFRGHSVTIDDGRRPYSGTFTLNEGADPKQIDFRFAGFPVNRGIYSLEGDRLRLKLLDTAVDRPARFGREPGYRVIVCRRARSTRPSPAFSGYGDPSPPPSL